MKKKIVKLKWLDAKAYTGEIREVIMNVPIKQLLCKCETYGTILKEDENGIVIMTEDGGNEIDCTVIPAGWYEIKSNRGRKKKK